MSLFSLKGNTSFHGAEEQTSEHEMYELCEKQVCIVQMKKLKQIWILGADKIKNKFRNDNPYFAESTSTKKLVRQIWRKEVRKTYVRDGEEQMLLGKN